VEFDATDLVLIICTAFFKYLKKCEYSEAEHLLFIDFKNAYVSFRWRCLYNIVIESGTP
jgi:hypothetical protein